MDGKPKAHPETVGNRWLQLTGPALKSAASTHTGTTRGGNDFLSLEDACGLAQVEHELSRKRFEEC